MSNFKVGKSRFSRFINGKGFYIALALCLVAIGAAAYVAANNSFFQQNVVSGSSSSDGTGSAGWNASQTEPTGNTLSGVKGDNSSSSAVSSSASSAASGSGTSSSPAASSDTSSSAAAPTIYLMPVNGNVLTAYSADKAIYDKTMDDWRVHDGIDIAANLGTPVKACADGTVLDVKVDDMLGQEVIIQHGGGIVSIYANLTNAVSVKKGQKLEAGDVIGGVGQTAQGEIALAPHLHFAITKNGQYVDPMLTMGKKG